MLNGIDQSNNGWTCALWFYPSQADIDSGFATLYACRGGDNPAGTFGIDLRGTDLTFYTFNPSTNYQQAVQGGVVADEWQLVVVRYFNS